MKNPFESLEARLSNIENLLLGLKHEPPVYSNDQEDILSAQEAADFLHLSLPTVYSKVSKGQLPFMKRSKRLYFSKEELTTYLKEGRRQGDQEILRDAHLHLKK